MRCWFGLAVVVIAVSPTLPASAESFRGYVTQIEVGPEVRVWIAPEKGMKGSAEVVLEPADALFPHKLALARDALSRKLPVKVRLGPSRNVVSFAVRLYPSKKQLQ